MQRAEDGMAPGIVAAVGDVNAPHESRQLQRSCPVLATLRVRAVQDDLYGNNQQLCQAIFRQVLGKMVDNRFGVALPLFHC